ncbi:hypothetical protein COXBURSA334_1354 [Coxiella burnetii Q321]|nr:hypothetical protein COXBURSA334_1354 [Coxiella burnetii Q321]
MSAYFEGNISLKKFFNNLFLMGDLLFYLFLDDNGYTARSIIGEIGEENFYSNSC